MTTFLLITPFFQTYGYANNIGIISGSATYLFFYAMPLTFFLLSLLPFHLSYFGKEVDYFPKWLHLIWLILLVYLPFK
ncbi:MAG: hypothetical protein ACI920_004062 [Saprospiraceae bacterium]|jgi:hypothetical protein